MRVIRECQAVVTDVVGRVIGFGHRAYGHRRDGVFLGCPLYLLEEFVHLFGHGAALRGLEDVSEAEDELPETIEFLLARDIVHAVNHRAFYRTVFVGLAFAAEFRYAAVGQQHELFDHLVRLFLLLEIDAQRLPVFVEAEFHLFAVERNRAVLEPLLAQRLRQPVERQYLFGVVAAAGLDDLLRFGIRETAVGVDHRAAEPLFEDVEVFVEREHR